MKNKYTLHRVIGGLIFAVGVVLGIVGFSLCESVGFDNAMIFIYIAVALLALGALWYGFATSFAQGVCNKCGADLNGCAYEYQEIRRKETTNSKGIYVLVRIAATCPRCGCVKVIQKEFYVGPGENVQYKVDQFCRDHFGH